MPFRLRKQHVRSVKKRHLVFWLFLLGFVGGIFYWFSSADDEPQALGEIPETITSSQKPWIRGGIYDRNLRELAVTIDRVSVYVRSREVHSFRETAKALAEVLALDVAALETQLKKGGLRIWVAEDITQEQEEAINKLGRLGVYLQKEEKRYYPYGTSGAHVLGFAENGVGLCGLESLYDTLLRQRQQERAVTDEPLVYSQDLVLTLDFKIQSILEEILSEIRREGVLQGINLKAAAYLLDSKSGALIGAAQVPGFNPNNFATYGREDLASMLFTPIFLPDTIRSFLRDCAGFYQTNNDAVKSGAWSVATSVTDTGKHLQLMSRLGFDRVPEVDFYKDQKYDEIVSGQRIESDVAMMSNMIPEVSTPINLLVAMSTLLHGMPIRSPYTLNRVIDGKTGESFEIFSKPSASEVLDLFAPGVNALFVASGSEYERVVLLGGEVMGQRSARNGGSDFVKNSVIFADIPAGGNPLALVLITETKERGPFAKAQTRQKAAVEVEKILEKRVQRIGILHMVTKGAEGLLEQEAEEYGNYQGEERFIIEENVVMYRRQGEEKKPVKMPDLQGLSLRKSLRLLQGIPVKISIEGAGRVVRQVPVPGTELKKNADCRLFLEQGATIEFDAVEVEGNNK